MSPYSVLVHGQKLQSFGKYGSGNGKFSSLRGVAVDGTGNILVVDNSTFTFKSSP